MVSFVCAYSNLWLASVGLLIKKNIYMGMHDCLFAVFQFCCIIFVNCTYKNLFFY